jgi:hypothetical protein
MTTQETVPAKKGSKPTHEIFDVDANGKPIYKTRVGAWAHSKGGGFNFTIDGKRRVMFPVKAKQPVTEEKSA